MFTFEMDHTYPNTLKRSIKHNAKTSGPVVFYLRFVIQKMILT